MPYPKTKYLNLQVPDTAAVGGGDYVDRVANDQALSATLNLIDQQVGFPALNATTGSASVFQVSGSSVQVLGTNLSRVGAYVENDSTNDLYVALGAAASTGSFTLKVGSGSFYEFKGRVFQGTVSVCYATVNSFTGSVRVTEMT